MFPSTARYQAGIVRSIAPVLILVPMGCAENASPSSAEKNALNQKSDRAEAHTEEAERRSGPLEATPENEAVAAILRGFVENREKFRTLHVLERRVKSTTPNYNLAMAGHAQRNMASPDFPENQRADTLAHIKQLRSTAAHSNLNGVLDFQTDREQFQTRSPRDGVDALTWTSPNEPVRPDGLANFYGDVTIYSFNPTWERPLRMWAGSGVRSRNTYGWLYSQPQQGQWVYEARWPFWFPPLTVKRAEWGRRNQIWHQIDEFFAAPGGRLDGYIAAPKGRFRLVKEEQIGTAQTTVVEQTLVRKTGWESDYGDAMHQWVRWTAWIDRSRGCLPMRMEYCTDLGLLSGRPPFASDPTEIVEVTEIQSVEGAGFYPIAGEIREYDVDPDWKSKSLTFEELAAGRQAAEPRVLTHATAWNIAALEANQPLDDETLALRFPDDVNIVDDGRPVEHLKHSPAVAPGDQAPDWRLAGWTDGKTRQLSDFRGDVVVLDFWALWCSGCRRSFPVLHRLQEKYRDRGVVVLSIHSAGCKATELERDVEQLKISIPVGLDAGKFIEIGETAALYGIRGLATYIVIGPSGKVAFNSDWDGDRSAREKFSMAGALVDGPTDDAFAKFNQMLDRVLTDEIEAALKTAGAP